MRDDYEGVGFVERRTAVDSLRVAAACDRWLTRADAARVLESDGVTVRSVYGVHLEPGPLRDLCCRGRFVEVARELLGGDVFVYQTKINAKAAFTGGAWAWHQDFIFWYHEDGMVEPRALTIMLYVDEVTKFNGAMYVIPGSHRRTMIDAPAAPPPAGYDDRPEWIGNLTEDLKYTVPHAVLRELVLESGARALSGPPGTCVVFHPNLVHVSPANLSPFPRRVLLITYCALDARFEPRDSPRPVFLRGTPESGACA